MQIIIPMSGFGERFRRAGYTVPKPLIQVDGKPIIAHVIDLFPDEKDISFICNEDHLSNPDYNMERIIKYYCPSAKIFSIPSHKLGPVNAVMQIHEHIDPLKPTIINYCDFSCVWDWADFKNFVIKEDCAGCIPAYKGFHPHSLGKTNYAYIKEIDGIMTNIKEKEPFTSNKMNEYASSGTYYFATGGRMLEIFGDMIANNENIEGEFYVSLAYKYLNLTKEKVSIYPLQHFMQWGTPEDLQEYNYWSETFTKLCKETSSSKFKKGLTTLIPMAGMGKRFSDEGYRLPKPLIKVSGNPMFLQSINDLPPSDNKIFILRSDMDGASKIESSIHNLFQNAEIVYLDNPTDGQARTVSFGLDAIKNIDQPVTIGTCDSGVLYNHDLLNANLEQDKYDLLVWVIKGYKGALENPEMYGWVKADEENNISELSVKKALDNPITDNVILGIFTFRNKDILSKCLNSLFARNKKINGEFYIDSVVDDALNFGLSCKIFEVESFLCWGTPNDLKTFNYWQSCFHLWNSHPYSIDADQKLNQKESIEIKKKIYSWKIAQK
jgi:NDP-sugar pyrophosphorylase family protein